MRVLVPFPRPLHALYNSIYNNAMSAGVACSRYKYRFPKCSIYLLMNKIVVAVLAYLLIQ